MGITIRKRTLASVAASALIILTVLAVRASAQTMTGSINPVSISQGGSVTITISLSGGLPLTEYRFDVVVTNPSGQSSKSDVSFQTDLNGSGSGSTAYPSNFGGANTDQAGQYSVRADQTKPISQASVWTGSFTVTSQTTSTTTTTTTIPPFDFSLSIMPVTTSLVQGDNVTIFVMVQLVSGTPQNVTLSAFDNLGGTSINFVPNNGFPSFSSTVSVLTSNSTSPGMRTITVTGIGGGKTHSSSFTLTVRAIVKMNVDVSTFIDSNLSKATSSFKRGEIIFLRVSASYENTTKVSVAKTTFSLYKRDSILKFDQQQEFWLGSFRLAFGDPIGNQSASITVIDAEGNTASCNMSITVNPSFLSIESFSARDETGFPRLSFGINETLHFFFKVRYENGSYLVGDRVSIQVKVPNGYTVVTMVAIYDNSRLGFYTNDGYQTSFRDLMGQWTAILIKDSIDDGNGNTGPRSDFSHSFTVLKPSSILVSELSVGFYSDSSYSTQKSKFVKDDVAYIKVDARYANGTVVDFGSVTAGLRGEFYSLAFNKSVNAWVGSISLNSVSEFGPQMLTVFLDDGRGAFVRRSASILVEEIASVPAPSLAWIPYSAIFLTGSVVTAAILLRRRTIGLEHLDHLTGGGIPEGSSVMLLGEEGSGKSTLALSLICRDMEKGKPSLILSYDSFPESVLKRIESLGCNQVQNGDSLRVLDCYRGQADPSASIEPFNLTNLSILVSSELKRIRGARVLVDSVAPLFNAIDHRQVLSFLQVLSIKVKQQEGILFLTLASQTVPVEIIANLQAFADGVVDLAVKTEKGRRQRYLTVKKMHERRVIDAPTPFVISRDGKILFLTRKLRFRIPHS